MDTSEIAPDGGRPVGWSRARIPLGLATLMALVMVLFVLQLPSCAPFSSSSGSSFPMTTEMVAQHYRRHPGFAMPLPTERAIPGEGLLFLDSAGASGVATVRTANVSTRENDSMVFLCAEPASDPPLDSCPGPPEQAPDRLVVVDGTRVAIYVQRGGERIRRHWMTVSFTSDYTRSPLVSKAAGQ